MYNEYKRSKISNILLMLQYLQNRRKYSIKELSERLEISPRMIRQYKSELEYAGIYIETIYGPYGGYVLNQDVKIPEKFIKPANVRWDNREYYNLLSKFTESKGNFRKNLHFDNNYKKTNDDFNSNNDLSNDINENNNSNNNSIFGNSNSFNFNDFL